MNPTTITGHAEVCAVLADPDFQVPPAAAVPDGEVGTLAWLRSSASRFSEGQAHTRRRALAERDIAAMDPARLRRAFAAATKAELARCGREPFDVMGLARRAPLSVLAAELGMTGAASAIAAAAIAAATGYLNPDQAGSEADSAVAVLAGALGPADPEVAANRIALLMQACDATAGLIGNAIARAATLPGWPARHGQVGATAVGELLAQTLRDDPPVLRTRRLSPAGDVVLVDITALPFGSGRRPCPGADQATALAAGVLDSILSACVFADSEIVYPESGNLRVPMSLFVVLR